MDVDYRKNMKTEKTLSIFKSNSPLEDDVIQKWKIETVELIFFMASENVIVFEVSPWEDPAHTNVF